jgi:hypothetical protein
MTRSSMSTLPKKIRREIKESSRPLTVKPPVFTDSDWSALARKVPNLDRQTCSEHTMDSDWSVIPEPVNCEECAYWKWCDECFYSGELTIDLLPGCDYLAYLKFGDSRSMTYCAEEVSTKGAKKDRTCWNHAPTRHRLQGAAAKRRRASACASKLKL